MKKVTLLIAPVLSGLFILTASACKDDDNCKTCEATSCSGQVIKITETACSKSAEDQFKAEYSDCVVTCN